MGVQTVHVPRPQNLLRPAVYHNPTYRGDMISGGVNALVDTYAKLKGVNRNDEYLKVAQERNKAYEARTKQTKDEQMRKRRVYAAQNFIENADKITPENYVMWANDMGPMMGMSKEEVAQSIAPTLDPVTGMPILDGYKSWHNKTMDGAKRLVALNRDLFKEEEPDHREVQIWVDEAGKKYPVRKGDMPPEGTMPLEKKGSAPKKTEYERYTENPAAMKKYWSDKEAAKGGEGGGKAAKMVGKYTKDEAVAIQKSYDRHSKSYDDLVLSNQIDPSKVDMGKWVNKRVKDEMRGLGIKYGEDKAMPSFPQMESGSVDKVVTKGGLHGMSDEKLAIVYSNLVGEVGENNAKAIIDRAKALRRSGIKQGNAEREANRRGMNVGARGALNDIRANALSARNAEPTPTTPSEGAMSVDVATEDPTASATIPKAWYDLSGLVQVPKKKNALKGLPKNF